MNSDNKLWVYKRFCLLLLGMILLGKDTHAQSNSNCKYDSASYQPFLIYLDTCNIKFFDPEHVYNKFIKPHAKDSCLCNLLLYVRIFDYLLNNDLDIRYDLLQSPPISVSSNLSPDDPYILEMKKNRRRYRLYTYFIFIKSRYDINVLTEYELNKEENLQNDVNNTLKYNLYCKPLTLKEILSVKNGHKLLQELGKKEDIFFRDH
jgi:hypothetical protein